MLSSDKEWGSGNTLQGGDVVRYAKVDEGKVPKA